MSADYMHGFEKISYEFTLDPIDVVMPCHEKDLRTINLAIEGIKKNVRHRRIIIISKEQLTDKAEWFDESLFPFSLFDIAYEIFKDHLKAQEFINHPKTRIGWIYQQFLKLYAPFVVPDISPNILIVDADTIFLQPVNFQDAAGSPLFNVGTEYVKPYFEHISRILPGVLKQFSNKSGICHHMLLQKNVMTDLFSLIRNVHNEEPWKVICATIDRAFLYKSCMSEYELYFNFIFGRTNQPKIRPLRWKNVSFAQFNKIKKNEFDYVSCHAYM